MFEYAVEITPGVGEGMSGGIINMFANAIGFFLIVIIQSIDDGKNPHNYLNNSLIIIGVSLLISLIAFCLVFPPK